MTRLLAEFVYEFERVLIARELLGATLVGYEMNDYELEIAFPVAELTDEQSVDVPPFGAFGSNQDAPIVPGGGAASGSVAVMPHAEFARIDALCVRLRVERDLPATESSTDDAMETLKGAKSTADAFVAHMVRILRTRGLHPWLGLSNAPVTAVRSRLTDVDAGLTFPVGLGGRPFTVWLHDSRSILSHKKIDQFAQAAAAGFEPVLADELLADALFYGMAENAGPNAVPAAILLAAIACERKALDTLRAVVKPDGQELLEILLTKPTDYSKRAHDLFLSVMDACCGRSLKRDNKELSKAVDSLFQVRNQVAHSGETHDRETMNTCLKTAQAAFKWLNAVALDVSKEGEVG